MECRSVARLPVNHAAPTIDKRSEGTRIMRLVPERPNVGWGADGKWKKGEDGDNEEGKNPQSEKGQKKVGEEGMTKLDWTGWERCSRIGGSSCMWRPSFARAG